MNMLLLPAADSEGTVDETLFRFLVELEVAKAQRLRYCVSVVSLVVDSPEAGADLSRLAERFVDRVRSTDIIVPNPESSWTLLLVDAQPQALPSIVQRLAEQLGTLPWSAGGASYPGTARDAEDLLCQAAELGARAQVEGRQELYLQSGQSAGLRLERKR
jgi:hypothetical protein